MAGADVSHAPGPVLTPARERCSVDAEETCTVCFPSFRRCFPPMLSPIRRPIRRRAPVAVAAVLALLGAVAPVRADCDPPSSGLVAWYPADGSTVDLALGNDATLENGATYGPGRSGQAFSLDGDDDFVSAPSTGATDPLFAGTLAALRTT